MKIGNWHVGPNDSKLYGIRDGQIIARFKSSLSEKKENKLLLVGITEKGERVWSLEEELKEMRGHLCGLIRSRYGREMLDARKLALAEMFKLGGIGGRGSSTET